MTYNADFCGFPFQQSEMFGPIDQRRLTPPERLPDLVVCTSVPPFVNVIDDALIEHGWFVQQTRALSRRTAFIYGLQRTPENTATGGVIGNQDILSMSRAGISLMSLAYEMPTAYGGGFAAPDEPLTSRGEWLMTEMAEKGMALDLSHTGHRTCRDVLEYDDRHGLNLRIVASHVGCHAAYPHLRNLPDDVLKDISRRGGVIGLLTIGWMLGPEEEDGQTLPFMRHFEHLRGLLGPAGEHTIAIGSDGVYRKLDAAERQSRFGAMQAKLDPRGNFRPRATDEPEVFEGGDRIEAIRCLLADHGYEQALIDNVAGKNLARFFLRNP